MADELYQFLDNGVYHRFTPTIFSKTFGGATYIPTIISRSNIKITDNFLKSPVTFTFDALNSFAKSVLQEIPETPIQITIFKNGNTYWTGQVKAAARKSLTSIDIVCDSSFTVAIHTGQRYRMNMHCNHKVYSTQCGVAESNFSTLATATANSSVITIPGLALPNGYLDNGKATMAGQVRRILSHSGTTIVLSSPFVGVLTGTIILNPGCRGTKENCIAFNNLPNGLFFHKQSSKNPHGNVGLF